MTPEQIMGNPYYSRKVVPVLKEVGLSFPAANKYGARRSYSAVCGRDFASEAERRRGEELHWLQQAGQVSHLVYQPTWVLCGDKHHKARYSADFSYVEQGEVIVEDVKGVLTEAARVRIAWMWAKYGIEVKLVRKGEA